MLKVINGENDTMSLSPDNFNVSSYKNATSLALSPSLQSFIFIFNLTQSFIIVIITI